MAVDVRLRVRSPADFGAPVDDGDAPGVIVRSGPGSERILQRTGTARQARRPRDRFQRFFSAVMVHDGGDVDEVVGKPWSPWR